MRLRKRVPREIMDVENVFGLYTHARCIAREAANLRLMRKPPVGITVTGISDGGDVVIDVELTQCEYAAIRRYLLRNRERTLRRIVEQPPEDRYLGAMSYIHDYLSAIGDR